MFVFRAGDLSRLTSSTSSLKRVLLECDRRIGPPAFDAIDIDRLRLRAVALAEGALPDCDAA